MTSVRPTTAPRMSDDLAAKLAAAGIGADAIAPMRANLPAVTGDFAADGAAHQPYWTAITALQRRLGGPAGADAASEAAILAFQRYVVEARVPFLDHHAGTLYDRLTDDKRRFVRVEELVYAAADLVPGLTPTRAEHASEDGLRQAEKCGLDLPQGIVISAVMALPEAGNHLCHAMLLPLEGSAEALAKFRRDSALDLGRASVERRGPAALVTLKNPDTLNAEDETTLVPFEMATDVALLDPDSRICVLRGGHVSHPKHAGKRLFCSGINLTHLYWGKISYLFYISRDLGLTNKMFRGVAHPDRDPDEMAGGTTEKLWIDVIEGFAIGGGCQLVLVGDYALAADDAYLTLPARKEGIIPGMANLRLPRFVGDRIARQAIMYDRRLDCASPEGRLICDELVPAAEMEDAIDRVIDGLTSSGVVSSEGNRRTLRAGAEPLDHFRQFFAAYAREQVYCHFSTALIGNLERNWNAQNRKVA
jgi:thioesterase DpgC